MVLEWAAAKLKLLRHRSPELVSAHMSWHDLAILKGLKLKVRSER